MTIEQAARVGDPVAHTDQRRGNAMTIVSGLLSLFPAYRLFRAGLDAAKTSWHAYQALRGLLQGASFSGNAMGTALIVARLSDRLAGRETAGHIYTGAASVLIGSNVEEAANASTATGVDCHMSWVSQGSRTVYIEGKNASRRGDETRCGGIISAGCETVYVGGVPAFVPGERHRDEVDGLTRRILNLSSYLTIFGVLANTIRDPKGVRDLWAAAFGLGDLAGLPLANTAGQIRRATRPRNGSIRGFMSDTEMRARTLGVPGREIERSMRWFF